MIALCHALSPQFHFEASKLLATFPHCDCLLFIIMELNVVISFIFVL